MEIIYIGWCHQPTRNHDKVWGIAKHGHNHVTFWGRRGNKLQHNVKSMGATVLRLDSSDHYPVLMKFVLIGESE